MCYSPKLELGLGCAGCKPNGAVIQKSKKVLDIKKGEFVYSIECSGIIVNQLAKCSFDGNSECYEIV